jgi:hypothetical protein
MLESAWETAHNERSAPLLVAVTRPSPHHSERSRGGMADVKSIKTPSVIQCQLRLKLRPAQERMLKRWLWHLSSVYNWPIR